MQDPAADDPVRDAIEPADSQAQGPAPDQAKDGESLRAGGQPFVGDVKLIWPSYLGLKRTAFTCRLDVF